MTPDAGLSVNTFVTSVVFLFAAALLGACGQSEKPVRQDVPAEAVVAPLAVEEWYPTPKHMSRSQGDFSSPLNQQSAQMHTQTTNRANAQPWAVAPQQPAFADPPQVIVFQGQEYVPAQSQQRWSNQAPVVQPLQPWYQPSQSYAAPNSGFAQRPWGNVTVTGERSRANKSLGSWPPGNVYAPAGMPATGGFPANDAGQYWPPPANYYGNVW